MTDYYEILGITRDAGEAEIKKAYRKMARQYHPDINGHSKEAEAKFKEVAEAYEVLSDPQKRQMYDTYGHTGRGGGGQGQGFGGFGGFGQGAGFEDIFDVLFEGFGGRSRQRPTAEAGADLLTKVNITFAESAFGVEKEVETLRPVPCEDCGGSGASEGSKPKACSVCGGHGVVNQTQSTIFGSFARTAPCSNCEGTGKVITSPCKSCSGEGRKSKREMVKLKVPAGIIDGMRLQLSGFGGAGRRGGPSGDLYVDISVTADKLFKRVENDVVVTLPISYSHAALGGELTVPTLDGEEKVSIPVGTQTGTAFRIKGKGFRYLDRRGRGDQIVETVVETPVNISEEQKRLLFELAEVSGETGDDNVGIFKKIKEALGR